MFLNLRITLNQFKEFSHYRYILEIFISILETFYLNNIFSLRLQFEWVPSWWLTALFFLLVWFPPADDVGLCESRNCKARLKRMASVDRLPLSLGHSLATWATGKWPEFVMLSYLHWKVEDKWHNSLRTTAKTTWDDTHWVWVGSGTKKVSSHATIHN